MAPSLLAAWRVACYEVEKRYSFRFLDSVLNGMDQLELHMRDKGYTGKVFLSARPGNRPDIMTDRETSFCSMPINDSGAAIYFIPDAP